MDGISGVSMLRIRAIAGLELDKDFNVQRRRKGAPRYVPFAGILNASSWSRGTWGVIDRTALTYVPPYGCRLPNVDGDRRSVESTDRLSDVLLPEESNQLAVARKRAQAALEELISRQSMSSTVEGRRKLADAMRRSELSAAV